MKPKLKENNLTDLYYDLPWENIGHALNPESSVEQMLDDSGLNWDTMKCEIMAKLPPHLAKTEVPVSPEAYALVRNDNYELLSVVGARYKVIQNSDAFETFQEIAKMGNLQIETAGQMEGGKTVWALAKILGYDHSLSDSEYISGYFLFQQSFAQGSALKMMFMPMRFPGAISLIHNKTTGMTPVSFRLQHCKKLSWANKEKISEVIDNAKREMEEFTQIAIEMSAHKLPARHGIQFMCEVMDQGSVWADARDAGQVESINAFVDSPLAGRTMSKVVGTLSDLPDMKHLANSYSPASSGSLWGYLMAVLYSIDHVLGHQHETRLYSAWFGLNNKTKLAAYEVAKRKLYY